MKLFLPSLDRDSSVPLYVQLYNYIRNEIESGVLEPYEKLPSGRSVAKNLNLSKNTVDSAYQLLKSGDYIISQERSGFYVSPGNHTVKHKTEDDPNARYRWNFSIHNIDISHIPFGKWNKALSGLRFSDPVLMDSGSRLGDFSLRVSISKFLREMNGINCSPHNIILGAGLEYLLQVIDRTFGKNAVYGFENPCHLNHYEIIKGGAGEICPIDIGTEGIEPERLYSSDANILYLTPEIQIPTGYFTSLEKRLEILEWAEGSPDRLIIENGCDSPLIYSDKKIPPLFSLDKTGRVIYINSFSRLLSPAVSVGFMVLPDRLLDEFKEKNRFYRPLVSRYDERAFSELFKNDLIVPHILNTRNLYREKRKTALSVLENSSLSSRLKIYNSEEGAHFLISLSSSFSSEELREKAADKGIKILPVSHYFIRDENFRFPPNTFVLGFGNMSKIRLGEALGMLAEAWKE